MAKALRHIKAAYGGNLIEFLNCSWAPPGNAIWQLQAEAAGPGARQGRRR